MSQFIGFISGIALTAGAIYYFTPDEGKEILDTLSQKTANSASQLYAQLPVAGLETVLAPPATVADSPQTSTATQTHSAALTTTPQTISGAPPLPTPVSAATTEALSRAAENPDAEPDATLADEAEVISQEVPATTAPAPHANTQLFWAPFENRQQAQGFIDYLTKKTGFVYELLTEQEGNETRYRAALIYDREDDLPGMLDTLTRITGPTTR